MTGAPDTARESCTHRGFIRKDKAHRGGTAFTTPSVLGQGAFLQEAAMDIGQRALDYHKNGYNCAQSVFAACCEYTGMDEKTALAISAGFGGGARSGELCGAVTGAIIAARQAAAVAADPWRTGFVHSYRHLHSLPFPFP